MNPTPRTAIVIGAGIVGASCAWHLQATGLRVTLLDHQAPGTATSYGNAGCISPSGIVPFSYPGVMRQVPGWLLDPLGPLRIRWGHLPRLVPWLWRFWRAGNEAGVEHMARAQLQLMQRVTADWDELLDATGAQALRESRGVIMVFDSEADYRREAWQFALKDRLGLAYRKLSPQQLRDREPALNLPDGVAVLLPDWQHVLDPGGVTRRIAEDAFAHGVTWLEDRAQGVSVRDEGAVVISEGGKTLAADVLVVAGGPWSGALVRQLDPQLKLPLIPKRGYHTMLAQPSVRPDHPIQSASRLFVMTPMADGLRLAGTAEFAALDAAPDYRRARVLVDHARHYFPGLEWQATTEWMGQRPMLPDSLPVIGRSPRHRNVIYAFGHGHWGLTQGPTTGRLVTDLVRGSDPGLDLAPYRVDRF